MAIPEPKEKDCAVAAVLREGRILVGLRHYTAEKWKEISVWTLPGGRCEPGETPEDAMRREAREEVGLTDLRVIAGLGTVPGAFEGDVLHVFVAESSQEPVNMEPEKFGAWEWKRPDELDSDFINPAALAAIKAHLATSA